ncbi:MAG: T9SS type A sorting domain-containing protein, partial [Bacteroidales bacterium]|nr:T9SS type A sorting domain-containing protein [Bacteroidales bacterium]
IKIYPNPARDYIEFNIQNIMFKTADLIIFDIFGRYVVNKEITTPYARIDVSKLPAGIYFYRLIIDEDILSGKIVISDLLFR